MSYLPEDQLQKTRKVIDKQVAARAGFNLIIGSKILKSKKPTIIATRNQPAGRIDGLAFARDGRLVSGGDDSLVKIWNLNPVKEVVTIRDHTAKVTRVAVSADGKWIVSSSMDGTVRVRSMTSK